MEHHNKIPDRELDQILDETLKSEPDFNLPSDFAELLSLKISKQSVLKQYINEFFLYLSVFMAIAGLSIATIYWMDQTILDQIILFIQQKYLAIIGINLILVFILFTDKVLLRYFHFRINEKPLSI